MKYTAMNQIETMLRALRLLTLRVLHVLAPAARGCVVVALFTGMIMLSPGTQSFVMAQASPDAYTEARARFDRMFALLEAVRREIDRTSFDVNALALALAFEEPDTIARWVRDNIAFEQYPGLLRGAQGTLMSRAGNSLDQAVLLATLLGDVGYEVRVQRSELTTDVAAILIDQIPRWTVDESADSGLDFENAIRQMAAVGDLDAEEIRSLVEVVNDAVSVEETAEYYLASTETEFLFDRLLQSGLTGWWSTGDGTGSVDGLVEEARDYFWVEYRLGSASDWQAVHPAFKEILQPVDAALSALEASSTLLGQVPEELQHRFRLEVRLEVKRGDNLEVVDLIAPWERPVANMYGRPISYLNFPDGYLDYEDVDGLMDALARTDFFYPQIDGRLAPGGQAFDLLGLVVDPIAANDPAAGVFRNVAGAFAGAAAALDDPDGDVEGFITVSAQWLDITLIAPGGLESHFRKPVLDRIAPEDRGAGIVALKEQDAHEVVARLAAEHSIMVVPGAFPADFLLDSSLEVWLNLRPMLELGLYNSFHPDEATTNLDAGSMVPFQPDLGLLKYFAGTDLAQAATTARSYRSSPALAVTQRTTLDVGVIELRTDVLSNPRRSLSVDESNAVVQDLKGNVFAGVFETAVENTYLEVEPEDQASAIGLLADARYEGRSFVVLTPDDIDRVGSLALSAEAVFNLRRDLERGFVAILPPEMLTARHAAWWRVDPGTGETLGMISSGEGGQITMYVTLIAFGVGLTTFLGCYAFAGGGESGAKAFGCFLCGAVAAAAVFAAALIPKAAGTITIRGVTYYVIYGARLTKLAPYSFMKAVAKVALAVAAAVCPIVPTQFMGRHETASSCIVT